MRKIEPLSPQRRRDRWIGLSIIVLSFVGCMGLSVWGMKVSAPREAPPPAPATSEGIPGFPDEVDPFDVVSLARLQSVREKFRGFVANGVDAEGVVDLGGKKAGVRYAFQSAQGRGPQPLRKPGTLPDRRYCGVQSVHLKNDGLSAALDNAAVTCGGRAIEDLIVPSSCSIKDIFELAVKKGFKPKGTATIEYFGSTEGPAYRIKKDGRSLVVSAKDCKRIITGRASREQLP